MLDLPVEITRKIYEYDSTYCEVFNKVLIQLKCHFLYIIVICVSNGGRNVYVIVQFVTHI